MKKIWFLTILVILAARFVYAEAQTKPAVAEAAAVEVVTSGYIIGIGDILDINILQPEQLIGQYAVAPDGSVSFPYIGNVQVNGMTLTEARETVQNRLSEGYMKYPVVAVALREPRSRKFFVYGEVVRPGSYILEDDTTVLKAISIAGGFSKYGSSSNVKVLRPNKDKPGYNANKINMSAVMNGNAMEDMVIQSGDIVVISEGIF